MLACKQAARLAWCWANKSECSSCEILKRDDAARDRAPQGQFNLHPRHSRPAADQRAAGGVPFLPPPPRPVVRQFCAPGKAWRTKRASIPNRRPRARKMSELESDKEKILQQCEKMRAACAAQTAKFPSRLESKAENEVLLQRTCI